MNKRERDRVSSLVWFVVAIGICFGSVRLSLGEFYKPGSGYFSFLAGGILGILSFLVFLQSFKGLPEDERRAFWPDPQRGLKATYVIISLILYAIGMEYLGFFFSTVLFLGILLKVIDPQSWLVVLAVSILGAIISYLIFLYWLDVQLPQGILGF